MAKEQRKNIIQSIGSDRSKEADETLCPFCVSFYPFYAHERSKLRRNLLVFFFFGPNIQYTKYNIQYAKQGHACLPCTSLFPVRVWRMAVDVDGDYVGK
jgi:hypothetical protein